MVATTTVDGDVGGRLSDISIRSASNGSIRSYPWDTNTRNVAGRERQRYIQVPTSFRSMMSRFYTMAVPHSWIRDSHEKLAASCW